MGNLDMLLVMNSGHLVPYNVPVPALDMITRLVDNLSFGDKILPKIEFTEENPESDSVALDSGHSWNVQAYVPMSLVALSCFVIGVFVGSFRKDLQYRRIPDGL